MGIEKEIIKNYIIDLIKHIQSNRELIESDKDLDKSCDIVDKLNDIDYDKDINSLSIEVKKLSKQWETIYSKL